MSFGEELSRLDLDKVREVFDDLITPERETESSQEDIREFMMYETSVGEEKFPAFKTIQLKIGEIVPSMLNMEKWTEEQVHGMFMGIVIVQLVFSGYADREVPDMLPPTDQ